MSEVVLEAIDLRRSFRMGRERIEVLRGVDLQIRSGDTVFLCGASGAGKSTLLYTMAGLERPEGGRVEVQGQNLYQGSEKQRARTRNRVMGFVFQSYHLLPELTALENVLLPALIDRRNARDRAVELLETVGLGQRLGHLPTELSGGEQQRVAIARALINEPAILFADEPTGNLDSQNGEAILDLLLALATEKGKTLLVVTHDVSLAGKGDRLLYMEDGRIRQSDDSSQ